jgi:hypothetical protein
MGEDSGLFLGLADMMDHLGEGFAGGRDAAGGGFKVHYRRLVTEGCGLAAPIRARISLVI